MDPLLCVGQTRSTATHRYSRRGSVTGGLGRCRIPLLLCRIGGGLWLGGRIRSRGAVARLYCRGSVTGSRGSVTSLRCRGTTVASLCRGSAVTGSRGSIAGRGGSVASSGTPVPRRGTSIAAALCGRLLIAGGLQKGGPGSGPGSDASD